MSCLLNFVQLKQRKCYSAYNTRIRTTWSLLQLRQQVLVIVRAKGFVAVNKSKFGMKVLRENPAYKLGQCIQKEQRPQVLQIQMGFKKSRCKLVYVLN